MSPEQAWGHEVDGRSDLFSFAVALNEMSTGVLPFRGDGSTEIINSILNRQPVGLKGVKLDVIEITGGHLKLKVINPKETEWRCVHEQLP